MKERKDDFMKKICFITLVMIVLFPNYNIHAKEAYVTDIDNKESISSYADIKEWRYKIENGSFYKRLYNVSKGRWEGPWIKL